MDRIIRGTKQYKERIFQTRRETFEALTSGQQPKALFITCSDSRIDPELLTQSEPGRLFIIRNAGNVVPYFGIGQGDTESGTIELAAAALGVEHIIVCGHSRCAAVGGLLFPERVRHLPILARSLSQAKTEYSEEETNSLDRSSSAPIWAVERHVQKQLSNLESHPAVAYALAGHKIHLHGWIYHLEDGSVTAYEADQDRFLPLDEVYPE